MNEENRYTLKVLRGIPSAQYWESFSLPLREGSNVISALMEIQKNPINAEGKKTTPIAWEEGCLEEVCGSCSMLINGRPRQACTALIEPLLKQTNSDTVTLAPFTKFPLVKDLVVDRTKMFEDLKKVLAWAPAEGSWDPKQMGPKISPFDQHTLYLLSTCMTCGCCTEACPQTSPSHSFMGPSPFSQIRRFNLTPSASFQKKERLKVARGEGGIQGCGNAQNCIQVCPKKIPLTESLAQVNRQAQKQAVEELLGSSDETS